MHIGILVFLRMFSLPILLAGAWLYMNSTANTAQNSAEKLVTPGLAEIQHQFKALGGNGISVLPIAQAKFTSGRQMLGQTLNLSGGGFTRP